MKKNCSEKDYFNELIYKPVIKDITNHVVENLLNEFEDRQRTIGNSSDFINFLKNRNKKIDELEKERIRGSSADINFCTKLPAINKHLKTIVDYSNFIIDENIVKTDSKSMTKRRQDLEEMIKEYNSKLIQKYNYSFINSIDIDKIIKDSLNDTPTSTMISIDNKNIISLNFEKPFNDLNDIGYLFDYRYFVNPRLLLLLINYMAIKYNSIANLRIINVSIVTRDAPLYDQWIRNFCIQFNLKRNENSLSKSKFTTKKPAAKSKGEKK